MTLALLAAAALCTVNAPRNRTCLPTADRQTVATLGSGVTGAAVVVLALAADGLLDLVSVSAPTARIAAGALLLVTGVLTLALAAPAREPALPGRRAALVPVAFPTLLSPALAALAVAAAADHGPLTASAVLLAALVTVPAVAALAPGSGARDRALDGLGRVLAAGTAVTGIALLWVGAFDV